MVLMRLRVTKANCKSLSRMMKDSSSMLSYDRATEHSEHEGVKNQEMEWGMIVESW